MSKKKYRILSAVFAVLSVLCLVIIFHYGTQSNVESRKSSDKVTEKVKDAVEATGNTGIADTPEKRESLTIKVRKSAHAAEYFALGLCSALTVAFFYCASGKNYPFFPAALCFAAAITDEYIQGNLVGRTSSVSDIVIDVCGAAAGIILVAAISGIIRLVRKKRNRNA